MAKMVTPEMERINAKIKKRNRHTKNKYSFWRDAWLRLKRNKTAVFGIVLIAILAVIAILAPVICRYDPYEVNVLEAWTKPGSTHWFGTDSLGRDLFARCMYGARVSLPMGLFCMVTGLVVGGLLGLISGFFGGKADNVIMRIMDVFQSIPGTLMTITIIATLGIGIPTLVLAITISGMSPKAKTTRAAILSVRSNEYIEAARCIGVSNWRLMLRHMLPNAVGPVIIYAVGSIATSIMIIATMSYIGLGIAPPTPEWGSLLSTGKEFISSYPYLVVFPGLMIMITVLGFNLFGDGLRDALDPRLK